MVNNYTFNKKEIHNVTILLNFPNIDSGKMMFYNISNVISINFTDYLIQQICLV